MPRLVLLWFALQGLHSVSHGRNSNCPPPDQGVPKFLECLKEIVPHMDHPIYAPIIGGADLDYAKDMCKSESWTRGIECLVQLSRDCTSDPKWSAYINAMFNKEQFENNIRNFCNRLNEYSRYVECYFENRDLLSDCVGNGLRDTLLYLTNNVNASVSDWISVTCRYTDARNQCQEDGMRYTCGAASGKFLRDFNRGFRSSSCNDAQRGRLSGILVSALVLIKLFML